MTDITTTFAEDLNVSRQTISNWENGKSLPDIVSIIRMSELYDLSLDELLKGDATLLNKIERDMKVAKAENNVIKFAWPVGVFYQQQNLRVPCSFSLHISDNKKPGPESQMIDLKCKEGFENVGTFIVLRRKTGHYLLTKQKN